MKIVIVAIGVTKTFLDGLVWLLADKGHQVKEIKGDRYPLLVQYLDLYLSSGKYDLGIAISPTGNEFNTGLNQMAEMEYFSVLAWNPEIARLAKAKFRAKVLCLPHLSLVETQQCIHSFLNAPCLAEIEDITDLNDLIEIRNRMLI